VVATTGELPRPPTGRLQLRPAAAVDAAINTAAAVAAVVTAATATAG